MPQMTMAATPDFNDIPDSSFNSGSVLTSGLMVKLNENSKFGCVRCEYIFMGFFANGNTVGTPLSPVDDYAYSQAEVMYLFNIYSTRAPLPGSGFAPGQSQPPVLNPSQPANLYYFAFDIDDSTGLVSCLVSYYQQGGSETVTTDGVLKVYAVGQRQSQNVPS